MEHSAAYNGQTKDVQMYGLGRHTGSEFIYDGYFEGVRSGYGRLIFVEAYTSEEKKSSIADVAKRVVKDNKKLKEGAETENVQKMKKALGKMVADKKGTIKVKREPIVYWYEGYFESDKKHGYGILTKSDGNTMEGVWENDLLKV